MTAAALERFRASVLFVLRREFLDLSEGKLPPIMAEKRHDAITANLSRDQQLLAEIFWGSVEMWESHEALRDIETYLSRNPYSRLGVDKHRYLRYHVTNYLNEVYILQERLQAFTTGLLRKYRKNGPADLAAISGAGERGVTAFQRSSQREAFTSTSGALRVLNCINWLVWRYCAIKRMTTNGSYSRRWPITSSVNSAPVGRS